MGFNIRKYREAEEERRKRRRKKRLERAKYQARIAELEAKRRRASSGPRGPMMLGADPFSPMLNGSVSGPRPRKKKKRYKYVKVEY